MTDTDNTEINFLGRMEISTKLNYIPWATAEIMEKTIGFERKGQGRIKASKRIFWLLLVRMTQFSPE